MVDEADNVVLHFLRGLRDSLDGLQAEVRSNAEEFRARLGGVEAHLAQLAVSQAALSTRMDTLVASNNRLEERLTRIERTLDRTEA